MPGHKIQCLYCFNTFNDEDVHFRMETVFNSEDDVELTDPQTGKTYYSPADVAKDPMLSGADRTRLTAQLKLLDGFVKREDPKYEKFWERFGRTTEMPAAARDGQIGVNPWLRRVYDPHNPDDQPFFQPNSEVISDSGLLYQITDIWGRETSRRVCPYCHNPLPGLYGKYPVKFISIIGITGAGKTVYLSQLVQYLEDNFARCGITAQPTSTYAYRYRETNPVEMGKRLPAATAKEMFLQPLCFDLSYKDEAGRQHYMTMVFYDIAGENCRMSKDAAEMDANARWFGPFIEHSDGILLLVQPDQFTSTPDPENGPQAVLTVVHNLFESHAQDLERIPVAVCISKGDTLAPTILSGPIPQIEYLKKSGVGYRPVFNADSYNTLYEPVYKFVDTQAVTLLNTLSVQYPIHDLFLVSAIGTKVTEHEDEDGKFFAPATPPIPQRLIEPLLWMLTKFNFIGFTGFIREPNDWACPQCNRPLHIDQKLCPDCKRDRNGRWVCPLCGTVNEAGATQCAHTEKGFLGMTKRCKGVPVR